MGPKPVERLPQAVALWSRATGALRLAKSLASDEGSQYESAPGIALMLLKAHAPFFFKRPEGLPIYFFVVSRLVHAAEWG